jgi:hypothetical protein
MCVLHLLDGQECCADGALPGTSSLRSISRIKNHSCILRHGKATCCGVYPVFAQFQCFVVHVCSAFVQFHFMFRAISVETLWKETVWTGLRAIESRVLAPGDTSEFACIDQPDIQNTLESFKLPAVFRFRSSRFAAVSRRCTGRAAKMIPAAASSLNCRTRSPE